MNSRLRKEDYLIRMSPAKLIRLLDEKIEQSNAFYGSDELREFIEKRLLKIYDLKKAQQDPKYAKQKCIHCGVKQRIKAYLARKDQHDELFTKTPYKNKILRKQLEAVEGKPGEKICTHFESIQSIKEVEKHYFETYKSFMSTIKEQSIVTKHDVINLIC